MKPKIIKLVIKDNELCTTECPDGVLDTFYLVNPNENKLAELKRMIEHRFDYDGLTDEEIEAVEEMCDDIWGYIYNFIAKNFVVLNINDTYEIAY